MPSIEKVSVEKHVGDAIGLAYHKGHVFSGGIDGKIKVSAKIKTCVLGHVCYTSMSYKFFACSFLY